MTITTFLALTAISLLATGDQRQEMSMHHARGEFDVQVLPRELDGPVEDADLSRLTLVKEFRGALEGTGHGQMLAAGGPGQAYGAYVAIERVSGTLEGRTGSFVLMHRGTMDEAGNHLEVTVVPGSGTGELQGIHGKLEISVVDGQHTYDLAYGLP